jgi:D-lactate dehydrogenase
LSFALLLIRFSGGASSTLMPLQAGCCDFAGDRGFVFSELGESATRDEAVEIRAAAHDGHFSSTRTCEIGMTRATGRTYRSYIYMLEATTRR